jgi:hypothetical protein
VEVHDPARLPPISASTQSHFDAGHEIGDWAKKRYPAGVEIPHNDASVTATREAMQLGVPLFEASFSSGSCYCKVDILVPGLDGWDLIEVKGSTSVKDEHLLDVAFQRHVLAGAGVLVRRCYVMYVNNAYMRQGPIDVSSLFALEDVTLETDVLMAAVPTDVERLLTILAGPEPRPRLGVDCVAPTNCPVCAPSAEILSLYRIGARAWPLLEAGVCDFSSLPADFPLNARQRVQVEAHTRNEVYVDKKALSSWLASLVYPLWILDFETFNSAIPPFDGVHPYEHIPFQFSLHVVNADGSVVHHECLGSGGDPRTEIVTALRVLGPSGSVLAHNASFERTVMEGLALRFPADAPWLRSAISRLVDTIVPFREFWYYDPRQHGSCSLKVLVPVLTGSGYDDLAIGKGDLASSEYVRVTYGSGIPDDERARVRAALLEYCGKDTASVIEILRVLKKSAE